MGLKTGFENSLWYKQNPWALNNGKYVAPGPVDDAAAVATLNAKFGASEIAALWGKPIPITWGQRRITGQLLQIGLSTQKTIQPVTPQTPADNPLQRPPTINEVFGQPSTFQPQTLFTTTFAYVFGAPGNPDAKQILRKLWFNGQLIYDVDQGAISTDIIFQFYQGTETQLPDVELNRERYDHPVGYRGMMYIVFYNYALPNERPDSGNPLIEAEFVEELANAQPETTYDNFDGAVFNVDFNMRSIAFDAKRNLIYIFGDDNQIYKYEGKTYALLDVYPVTGIDLSGGATFHNRIFNGFMLNGAFYVVGTPEASNSRRLFLINADTGAVGPNFIGVNSSQTNPNTPGGPFLAGIDGASVTVASTPEGNVAFLGLTSIFNYTYSVRVTPDAQLVYMGHTNEAGDPNGGLLTVENGQVAKYTCLNGDPNVYRNGAVWYTLPHDVSYILESPIDDAVVVFGLDDPNNWTIIKLYTKDISVAWEYNQDNKPQPDMLPPDGSMPAWSNISYTARQRIAWTNNNNTITTLNFLSGEMTTVDAIASVGTTNRIYDAYTNSFIMTSNSGGSHLLQYPILQQTTTNMPLSTLLRNLAERQGYDTADITIEGIPDTILGAAITEVSDLTSILEDIRVAYNFEIIKRGSKIKFTRRGYGSDFEVDATLQEADLALLSEGDNEYITVESEVASAVQTAGTIRVRFIDPAFLYTVNEYLHKRNSDDVDLSTERVLNLPIIMSTDEAAAIAMRALLQDSMSGMRHNFRLPQRFLAHEPGDIFELIQDGYTDSVRAIEIAYNADWSMSVQSEAVYTDTKPNFVFTENPAPVELPPILQGEAKPIVFDTTLIRAGDQISGSLLETYFGAVSAGRLDIVGSNTLHDAAGPIQPIPAPLVYGSAIARLSPTSPVMCINYDEQFRFRVITGDGSEYATDTVENVLAGANRLLVGNTGRWEQIGFIEAAFDSTTKAVTLTGIIRGLRGTEPYAATHSAGDYVVRSDDPGMILTGTPLGDLGRTVSYAIGDSLGRVNTADAVPAYVLGMGRRPWAVANPHAVASGGDVGLSWQRRTRLSGPLLNGSPSVPLDEASERYELEIYRAGSIVRTVTGLSSPAFNYTAAMQSADGWSGAITSIQLAIYQISATVGRGFTKTGTYDVN